MHISEGVLSPPVLAVGAGLAVAGVGYGLSRLDYDDIPKAGVMSAAFFVASLVHVPLGPSSVHLIINGLVGLVLGWAAFPAIFVALLLQAVFFSYGGLTVLGVNTVLMAGPAVACGAVFGPLVKKTPPVAYTAAFACGFGAVFLSALVLAAALVATGEQFTEAAIAIVTAHSVIMAIEGLVTLFVVAFLRKVQPGLLPGQGPIAERDGS